MKTMNDWHYTLEDYLPAIVTYFLHGVIVLVQLIAIGLIPSGAYRETHKLYKLWRFFRL